MSELLRGATLIEYFPARVERADLRVEGGRILERAPSLQPRPGELVTELEGKLLAPGMVTAHTHLYASLARGMPAPATAPKCFSEIDEQIWWRLDRALDAETVELAAQVGATEALLCGVTTVFDHHSSPSSIEGSLSAVQRGVEHTGVRAVISYEITDRNGPEARNAALRETERFLESGGSPRCRAMVGAHASYTLESQTLQAAVELARRFGVGLHLNVAEAPDDERESRRRFQLGVMERLGEAGVLGPRSVLAHCNHLAWEELSRAQQQGAWLVHNARSNMSKSVGYAPAGKFGARKALGTDGFGSDVLSEAQYAWLKSMEAGQPIDACRWIGGGQLLAAETFGLPFGTLQAGAAADLVVMDYPSPTPIRAENLNAHLQHGLSPAHVESVMVDGAWRLWARQILSFDHRALCARAQEAARRLWERMGAPSAR